MTYPCRICNVPGRVTTSLHEPCPTCRREIADWDPPHPSSEEVSAHGRMETRPRLTRVHAYVAGLALGGVLGTLTVLLSQEAIRVL